MLTYQKLVLNLFFFYYIIPVFSNKFNAEFSRKLIKRLKISNCNHSQKKCQRKFPFPQIYELIIGHFNTPASFFPNKPASMLFSFYFLWEIRSRVATLSRFSCHVMKVVGTVPLEGADRCRVSSRIQSVSVLNASVLKPPRHPKAESGATVCTLDEGLQHSLAMAAHKSNNLGCDVWAASGSAARGNVGRCDSLYSLFFFFFF